MRKLRTCLIGLSVVNLWFVFLGFWVAAIVEILLLSALFYVDDVAMRLMAERIVKSERR